MLTQTNDSGGTDFSGLDDDGCSGFVGEESLDVDMLMAGSPNCADTIPSGWGSARGCSGGRSDGGSGGRHRRRRREPW
jgi:hypothetical protein